MMKNFGLIFILLTTICSAQIKIKTGVWRGTLLLNAEKQLELPFNFEIKYNNKNHLVLVIHNAQERILIEETSISKDILILEKNHFERNPSFHISRNDSSIGIWYTIPAEKEDANQSITSITYSINMKLVDKAVIDLPKRAELCKVYRVDKLDSGKF